MFGTIPAVHSYCYLGIPINTSLSWEEARRYREALAQTSMESVVAYVKSQHLRHMLPLTTHFNANVMQTLLYGCCIWGWQYLEQWDLIDNPFQRHLSDFLKSTLRLPRSTPHVALLCESGIWPVLMYAAKHAVSFISELDITTSQVLKHLSQLDTPASLGRQCRAVAHRFYALASRPPPVPLLGQFANVLEEAYLSVLHNMKEDPRGDDTMHRKISSYLSWVWDGKLHKRPKFYDMMLDPLQFYTCMHARLMDCKLPAYVCTNRPLANRVCPLCGEAPCDLRHALVECTYTSAESTHIMASLSPAAVRFPQLLRSGNIDVWRYIASRLAPFAGLTKRAKRSGSSDDVDWHPRRRARV